MEESYGWKRKIFPVRCVSERQGPRPRRKKDGRLAGQHRMVGEVGQEEESCEGEEEREVGGLVVDGMRGGDALWLVFGTTVE